jgi:hypothetical protein
MAFERYGDAEIQRHVLVASREFVRSILKSNELAALDKRMADTVKDALFDELEL